MDIDGYIIDDFKNDSTFVVYNKENGRVLDVAYFKQNDLGNEVVAREY